MKKILIMALFLSLVLTACSSINASPSSEVLVTATVAVPVIYPTTVSPPPVTPTPTKLPPRPGIPGTGRDPTASLTSTPANQIDFSGTKVISMAHLDNGYFLVTVQLTAKVEEAFRATVEEAAFNCMMLEQYPDRLYCSGKTKHAGHYARFSLYRQEGDKPVYETEIGIPPVYITSKLYQTIKSVKTEEEPVETVHVDRPTPVVTIIAPYPYPAP